MVYHYSDGTLEYEEHFNASNVLQEVLKYSYDADGNVEYLLYKDNNFSNANAYVLYYYVRDAVGNITDLFQIREQSGSSTTVVNRIAAHDEYDPYGNILSVDTYNNDPIGDINPIRYKDYYYDLQTGWYQLRSCFYDPEVGRFLNADDLSLLMNTDSGVVDKNLYAYCDGNPVMRKDKDGDIWGIILIGAAIGAAFEIASQYVEYGKVKDWKQVVVAAGTGALCAAAPIYAPISAGVGSLVQDYVAFDRKNTKSYFANSLFDAGVAASTSFLFGKASKNIIKSIQKPGTVKVRGTIRKVRSVSKRAASFTRGMVHSHFMIFEGGLSFLYKNGKRY